MACVDGECSVGIGFLPYQPSVAGNAVVAGLFGLLATAVAVLGVWYRTPIYSAIIVTGLLMEVMGYIGRVLLHFSGGNMNCYVIFLLGTILGCTFITTAVFLILPHYIGIHGGSITAIRPRYVNYMFAALSLLAFAVQAVGCAFAATGFNSTEVSRPTASLE